MHAHVARLKADELPARGIPLKEGIGTVHGDRQLGEMARVLDVGLGIRPGPGRGHHGLEANISNLVVLDLVDVTIDHAHLLKRLQERLHGFSIVGPEIPALVDLL
ncbi:MAG: hypothetical protein MUP41_14650, partial [Desulfobacterales bacterium]|nr:hypothetical protein [Desulfobacterales bacterium]